MLEDLKKSNFNKTKKQSNKINSNPILNKTSTKKKKKITKPLTSS